MGTRSQIAKQIGPDAYRTVYCQLEGHLESQGAMLLEHFNTQGRVDQILDLGDLYRLFPKLEPDPSLPHTFDQPQKGVTLSYHRDGQCPDMDAKIETLEELGSAEDFIEFVYIFDQDQVWKYFQGGYLDEGLRDVKEDLEALENGIDVIKPPPFDFLDEFPEDWPEDDGPQEGMVMTGM